MRKFRWPVGARYCRSAAGLGLAAAVLTSSASAQTCVFADTLVSRLLPPVGATVEQVESTVRDVGAVATATSSAVIVEAPSVVDFASRSVVQPVVGAIPPGSVQAGVDLPPVRAVAPVGLEPGDILRPVTDRLDLDRSVASLCSALKGLGLQSGITVLSVTGFIGTIMGRLDSARGSGGEAPPSGGGSDGKMALGAVQKSQPSPQPGALGPFTVYASGTLLAGNSSDMPNAAGFTYGAHSGMIGFEYSVNRNLILGLAASFTRMDTDLTGGATADADVFQGAAYLSYATRQWFIDALAAYGSVALDMTRPGANDTVLGSTGVSALGLAARAAYLFDVGKIRVGPIAGISFVSARVDGYSEAGNDPTAMQVAAQSIDSLTGSAGVRFLAPFQLVGTLLVPYLNVTLEHQFGDGTGSVTTSLTQAPGAPVSLSFPIFGARDYGKIEGGLTIELAPEASISLSGASTFAREDGHDYRLSAGLNWRF